MSIREKPIYLSNEVHRALWLLAKADKSKLDVGIHSGTPDEIADDILRQAIREQHPKIFEHLKEIDKQTNEFIKTLQ